MCGYGYGGNIWGVLKLYLGPLSLISLDSASLTPPCYNGLGNLYPSLYCTHNCGVMGISWVFQAELKTPLNCSSSLPYCTTYICSTWCQLYELLLRGNFLSIDGVNKIIGAMEDNFSLDVTQKEALEVLVTTTTNDKDENE